MKLQILERVDSKLWDATVMSIGGTFFHSSVWANYTTVAYPHVVPQFFTLFSDDGDIIGLALGFQVYSRHKVLKYLVKRLSFNAIPVICGDDEENLIEFLRLLEMYARRSGNIELNIESLAYRGGSNILEASGFELNRRMEFIVTLERSEEDLWKGLEYKRRKNIKKAMRSEVKIEELTSEEAASDLWRLQGESVKRIVKREGKVVLMDRKRALDSIRVLTESGFGRIFGAKIDGKVESATLFTCFNHLVYSTLAGHSQKGFKNQAGTLLLWESIKRYRAEGASIFNLGGCKFDAIKEDSPEHGVYAYKKAFGAQCLECANGHKVLRKARHKVLTTLRSIFAN